MRNARTAVALAFAIAVALSASSANATFAGANGRIAFVRAGDIWTMNANGTGLTPVTTGGGAQSPSWRPDGQKIAYVDASGIELVNADGTGKQPLLADAGVMGLGLSWSPDCSSLAYGHADDPLDPTEHIWTVGVASSLPTQLTTGVTIDRSPDWSPDGSKIAFTSTSHVLTGANGSTNNLLYTMNSDGTGVTRLTTLDDPSGSLHERNPSWKPDGTAIVIRSDTDFGEFPRDGLLVVVSANGVTRTTLAGSPDPLVGMSPAWSPDQTKIAVGLPSQGSATASLFVYDVASGTSTTPIEGDQPDWVASNGSCSASDTVAPTLTLPASVAVDATGPSGAIVPFTATATDNVDPTPTVTCVPAALTLFPIGDTTVSCTAKDAAGNTATGSFGVHVRGAAEQLTRLAARIVADPGIAPRLRTMLGIQVLTLRNALVRGVLPKRFICLGLGGFVVEVRLLPPSVISTSSRAGVLADAQRIRDVLAC